MQGHGVVGGWKTAQGSCSLYKIHVKKSQPTHTSTMAGANQKWIEELGQS